MKLQKLIEDNSIKEINGDINNIEINDIQFDSRKVTENSLFVALKGTVVDGHNFIETATEKGAKAIVCEKAPENINKNIAYIVVEDSATALGKLANRWYGDPSSKLKLVGVTGTNGKTTIATLLYKLFIKLGYSVGLISTVCNYIDDAKIATEHTTPDALELNKLLAQMVKNGCQYAFMEVSSHAVEQKRIGGLQFEGGIFTNLTRDHIDYHLTFANYLNAKKAFFDSLRSNAFALTNIDDKNGMVMLQNTKARKQTYSIRTMADFKTKVIDDTFEGMQMEMNGMEIFTSFVGRFNASNLSAVFGAAILLGEEKLEVLRIISSLTPVTGRFETLRAPKGYSAIVDYAHTPDALKNVLSTINEILQNSGKLITVVGCGGNRDKGKRPMMAKEAVNGSTTVIFTSDNPRNEEPMEILNDMIEGLDENEKRNTIIIENRAEAIKTACTIAQKGDVVLIAGKGHEDYQIIKGTKHHFDDKEEVLKNF